MTSFLLSTENWDGVLLCPPSFQVFGNFWPGSQCLSFVFFCVNYLSAWTLINQDCDMLSLSYCAALSFHLRSRLPWAGIRYWYWYQFWILIVLYIDIGFRYWYCYDVLILKIDTTHCQDECKSLSGGVTKNLTLHWMNKYCFLFTIRNELWARRQT